MDQLLVKYIIQIENLIEFNFGIVLIDLIGMNSGYLLNYKQILVYLHFYLTLNLQLNLNV
jgi:hypothetical protein